MPELEVRLSELHKPNVEIRLSEFHMPNVAEQI
jgi:hypothetical protein